MMGVRTDLNACIAIWKFHGKSDLGVWIVPLDIDDFPGCCGLFQLVTLAGKAWHWPLARRLAFQAVRTQLFSPLRIYCTDFFTCPFAGQDN